MARPSEPLLTWAEAMSRANLILPAAVEYLEAPLRPVKVLNVGRTVRGCLAAIQLARNWKGREIYHADEDTGIVRGILWRTDEYWDGMEAASLQELRALRDALIAQAAPQ